MARYVRTPKFSKMYRKFIKGNRKAEKRVLKALKLFIKDPSYPSLHLEKLTGITEEAWTIRIDRKNRIFFYWDRDSEGKIAVLFNIGPHDLYRRI